MEFEKSINKWANGDTLQGIIMVLAGISIFVLVLVYIKDGTSINQGMYYPLGFLSLTLFGYGLFLSISRKTHAKKAINNFKTHRDETIQKEFLKAKNDDRNYRMLKPIWLILIIVSLFGYYFINVDYYKGLALSLGILFSGFYLLDLTLHKKLIPYLSTLEKMKT